MLVLPTGTKGWRTFSPGLAVGQGPLVSVGDTNMTKGLLVPGAKNAEANAKLGHRSKVCSLVVS